MNAKTGKKGAVAQTDAVSRREWPRVALGDVCEGKTGNWDPRDKPTAEFTYVDISSVDNVRKKIVGARRIVGKEAPSRARQIVLENDVIVSTTRPNLNAVAIVPSELTRQIASTGFCVLRPLSLLNPSYLFAFVQSEVFVQRLTALVQGSLYPAVSDTQVRAQKIPLPPLAEQQRIAARLREQLAAVETARRAVKSQLATAQALPAAHLRAVFESTAESKWPRRRLSEIVALLPARSIATAGDVEVRAITSAALTELGFNPAGIKRARMWSHDASESVVADGEILIARSNTAELVGRVSIFPAQGTDVVASDLLIRIKPNPACSAKYLARFLSYLYLTGYWRERASGASSSMKKITRGLLDALEIPLPPLATQRTIAARLDAELSATATLRAALEARQKSLEALPAALLREAFSEPA